MSSSPYIILKEKSELIILIFKVKTKDITNHNIISWTNIALRECGYELDIPIWKWRPLNIPIWKWREFDIPIWKWRVPRNYVFSLFNDLNVIF